MKSIEDRMSFLNESHSYEDMTGKASETNNKCIQCLRHVQNRYIKRTPNSTNSQRNEH